MEGKMLLGFRYAASTLLILMLPLIPAIRVFATSSTDLKSISEAINSPTSLLSSLGVYQDEMVIKVDGSPDDLFGYSIASDGDTLVVGAPYDDYGVDPIENQGSAYIFARSGNRWNIQQKITANDGALGNLFGFSVAVHNNKMFIGAPNNDDDKGSVYVFERSGTFWSQKQNLNASNRVEGDYFGSSLAISDSTLVVGAPGVDIGPAKDQGAVYSFSLFFGIWDETQKILSDDGNGEDQFGCAVAIEGNTLIVGAYYAGEWVEFSAPSGAAYIFAKEPIWTQKQKLEHPYGKIKFGRSVAISEETIAIGSMDDGGVLVYVKTRGSWILQQHLKDMGCSGDFPHLKVALKGDRLVVGSSSGNKSFTGACGIGLAYIFERSNGIWSLIQTLAHTEPEEVNNFGFSVALSNDLIIIGAPRDDFKIDNNFATPVVIDGGSVSTFQALPSQIWSEEQKLIAEIKIVEPFPKN